MDLVRTDREPCAEWHPGVLTVELNPSGIDGQYLAWLNICFKTPWSPRMYDWYLRRPFAGRRPDLLLLRERGRPVAGVGMNYRRLRLPGGAGIDVAVLTAGWTLPEARGRRLFDHVARASFWRATERGCALVLAFMTRDNRSARSMMRCGSATVPTTYLSASATTEPPRWIDDAVEARTAHPCAVEEACSARLDVTTIRFDYPRPEDWRSQFLDRSDAVELLSIGRCHAVVELTGDADRLQLLVGPAKDRRRALAAVAARARRRNRGFFAFASEAPDPEFARALGLTWNQGSLTYFVSRPQELRNALGVALTAGTWEIQSGDRM